MLNPSTPETALSSSPLVTVVIPAFNAEQFIGEAVASIRCQTIEDWQLIVVDDGSADQTLSAAREAAGDDSRIRLIRFDRNEGISTASNAGFDAAQGEFIARVDSDDRLIPHRLAAQVAAFRANDRLAAAGSNVSVFGDVPDGIAYCAQGDANIKARLLDGVNTISGGTLMVRRSFVRRHGIRFDDVARSAEDIGYLASVMAAGGQLENVNEVLTEHRSHRGSFTNSRGDVAAPWLQTMRRRLLALWYPDLDPGDIERIVIPFLNTYPNSSDEPLAIVSAINRLVSTRAVDLGQDVSIVHGIILDRMRKMLGIYQDNKLLDATQIQAIRHFVAPATRDALDQLTF